MDEKRKEKVIGTFSYENNRKSMQAEAWAYVMECGRNWVETCKQHKRWFAHQKALPPIVIAEKDDEVHCSIIASECDKHEGLKASHMVCSTIVPDYLTVIVDAHMYQGTEQDTDWNLKNAEQKFSERFPAGSLQKIFEEGRGKEMGVSECLSCLRIGRDKKIVSLSLPYETVNGEIVWDDENLYFSKEETAGEHMVGFLPETLRKLIDLESLKNDPRVRESAEKTFGNILDMDNADGHIAHAAFTVLTQSGFIVMYNDGIYGGIDTFSQPHVNLIAMSEDIETIFSQAKH